MQDFIKDIEDFIKSLGYYVWDISYTKVKRPRLEIFVDDVDLYQCSEISRKVSSFIEDKNLIPDSYLLTVSSPGINRKLTKFDHYIRSIGKNVKIKTGDNVFKGVIKKAENGVITISKDDSELKINFEQIEKANLNII